MTVTDETEVTIRPFAPADAARVRTLILAGLAEHWGYLDEMLNPDLDDIAVHYAGAVFLVAEAAGELMGAGALVPEGSETGRIVRMSVSRGWRRRSIGRRILDALLAAARERGYQRIVLETTATWEDATTFYRRAGFEPVAERDGDLHFVLALGSGAGPADEDSA